MPAPTPIRTPRLSELTAERPLTPAEGRLLEGCERGEGVVLGPEWPDAPPDAPTEDNEIRADLIRYLLLGGCADGARPDPKGVQVAGAFVSGTLDMEACHSDLGLAAAACRFENPPNFMDARLAHLRLNRTALPGLNAQRMTVEGGVFLRDGFAATGAVDLTGARIGGQLTCRGGRFDPAEGEALVAHGMTVGDGVFLSDGFAATGMVDLTGARIGGQLNCDGGRFDPAEGKALTAQGMTVAGDVFLRAGFAATGTVDLTGARIGGQLACRGGRFDPAEGEALVAQGMTVGDDVFLSDGFVATGTVDLNGARIGGQLNCDGGRFDPAEGEALVAQGMTVEGGVFLSGDFAATGMVDLTGARIGGQLACSGGRFDPAEGEALTAQGMTVGDDVFLSDGFVATGTVDLNGARIGGQLTCRGGRFDPAEGKALVAQEMTVGRGVFLSDGFVATGMVDLNGARIGGQLDCDGGRFDSAEGKALVAHGMTVAGDVFLSDGFAATGAVDLTGARIGGQLACSGGRFDPAEGEALTAHGMTVGDGVFLSDGFAATGMVDLIGARIGGQLTCRGGRFADEVVLQEVTVGAGFFWEEIAKPPKILVLSDAQVAALHDDPASWEGIDGLLLGGFRYDRIGARVSVRERLAWLARKWDAPLPERPAWIAPPGARDFDPQPYTHLAAVLDAAGHRRGAARVRMERDERISCAERARALVRLDGSVPAARESLSADLRRMADVVFRVLFGYGHAPQRALLATVLIVAFSALFYGAAHDAGQMAPNSDVVLTSDEWLAAEAAGCAGAAEPGCTMPLRLWEQGAAYRDYETFDRWGYAIDLFAPLDALGQEAAWAPSKGRGWLGWAGFYLRWAVQITGWLIAVIGAAVLTGVVGRKD